MSRKGLGVENESTFFAASTCRHWSEGQNLWLWLPLCNLCKKEEKLSSATHRLVMVLPSGAIIGINYTITLHSSSIIYQWVSESVAVPREWRDVEWVNTVFSGKVLLSFYTCGAEAKGTWMTLAHTTGPEVTSNFLNTIPKAQEGPIWLLHFSHPHKEFFYHYANEGRYSRTPLSPFTNCLSSRYILFPSSLFICQRAFYLSTCALQSNRKILQYCRAEVIWPRQLLFSSILQQTSWS